MKRCAGQMMWSNLCVLRKISHKPKDKNGFYIIGLDQTYAFKYTSKDYLWAVTKAYDFTDVFNQIKKNYCSLLQIKCPCKCKWCFN